MAAPLHEDGVIACFFAPLAGEAGLGLADDVARIRPRRGRDMLVTTDALVAGVHFFDDDPPELVAKKALRVNLSDLAAKGAKPIGFLLALALPRGFGEDALAAFAEGLGEDARRFECPLIGGDTVATPGPLTIALTAIGEVPAGRMVARGAVQPGDRLYVTGAIGEAALGLALRRDAAGRYRALSERARQRLLTRYLLPEPRLALAETLLGRARAAMDVSDGFVGDLSKMLRVSRTSARVELERAPLSSAARELIACDPALLDVALTGGDDYEILAAIPAADGAAFEEEARAAGVDVTCVGEAVAGVEPPLFIDGEGRARVFAIGSFSHF